MLKSLPVLEKDAQDILAEEVTVVMAKDLLNKLKEVFDSCKERGKAARLPKIRFVSDSMNHSFKICGDDDIY